MRLSEPFFGVFWGIVRLFLNGSLRELRDRQEQLSHTGGLGGLIFLLNLLFKVVTFGCQPSGLGLSELIKRFSGDGIGYKLQRFWP